MRIADLKHPPPGFEVQPASIARLENWIGQPPRAWLAVPAPDRSFLLKVVNKNDQLNRAFTDCANATWAKYWGATPDEQHLRLAGMEEGDLEHQSWTRVRSVGAQLAPGGTVPGWPESVAGFGQNTQKGES